MAALSPKGLETMDVGRGKKFAILASYLGSKWSTDSLVDLAFNPALEYGFGGSEYKRESVPLPLHRIKVKATLIGVCNLPIPPVTGVLTLEAEGNDSFGETGS